MRIVLVGERAGVVTAALGLGLEPVVLDPAAEPPQGLKDVAAVVALTEAAVVPAARLRAALGLPGVDVATAERCHDKVRMKETARAAGIPCTDWAALDASTDMDALVRRLGLPLVVKQRSSSGSRGLVIAQTAAEARGAPRAGFLAERFLDGVEMSVESYVAGGRVIFSGATEYFVPAFANIAPAALDEATRSAVLGLSARAIAALGIERGLVHCEIYRTGAGPVFGEVALRPPGGRIMRLLKHAYGFNAWRALLRVELGEVPELPARAKGFSGVWMLHPGPGRLRSVTGLDAARAVPGILRVVCRVGPGDVIPPREGTGQDVGFIEAAGASRNDVAAALERAHSFIHFSY